ncbi:hypothetical protein MMC13_002082 [Lambiella insularis]|nr:hypothetical protein [Lambiella insularis]
MAVASSSRYSVKVAVPLMDKSGAGKVTQATTVLEPSPASTYGASAGPDSGPVTPEEIKDSAIIAQSIRTSNAVVPRFSAVPLNREAATVPVNMSPSNLVATGRLSAPGSASATSTGSSRSCHRTNRSKDFHNPAIWHEGSEDFVKGQSDNSDVFFVANKEETGIKAIRSIRSPTVIKGVEVTNDNAQALLPPMACVFVANLSSTRTDEQLERAVISVFEKFGPVYVKIRRDHRGMPYAFAQYENVSDSERAIEHGRGIAIDGRQCRTERAKAHRSLYLSRVTGGPISEEEAREVLRGFEPFEKIWITSPTDKEMYRLPDGIWAFKDHPKFRLDEPQLPVDIKSRVDRTNQSPLTRVAPSQLYSPQLRIWRAPDRSSVYVGGLPVAVTQAQLVGLFQNHGKIRGVEIISRPVSSGTGIFVFAFVELSSEDEANRVVNQEYILEGLRLRVEIKHSPVQMQHRAHHTVSAGSPRRHTGAASSESMDSINSYSLAVSRAFAAGVHPAVVSFIFSGATAAQNSNPASVSAHTAIPAPNMAIPAYPPVSYDASHYHTQIGSYGTPTAQSEAEVSNCQYQYPQMTFHPYTTHPSYMAPQPGLDMTEGNLPTGYVGLH